MLKPQECCCRLALPHPEGAYWNAFLASARQLLQAWGALWAERTLAPVSVLCKQHALRMTVEWPCCCRPSPQAPVSCHGLHAALLGTAHASSGTCIEGLRCAMCCLAVCVTNQSSTQHQVATVCAGKRLSIDRQQQTGSVESGSGVSLSKASPASSLSRPLQAVRQYCLAALC